MYKERLENLVAKMVKKEGTDEYLKEDLEFLERAYKKILEYPGYVAYAEARIHMAKARYMGEPELYQEKVKKIDEDRVLAHQGAINSMNQINRLCDREGVLACFEKSEYNKESIYKTWEDRIKVANLCDEILKEFQILAKARQIEEHRIIGEIMDKITKNIEIEKNTCQEPLLDSILNDRLMDEKEIEETDSYTTKDLER